LGSGRCSSFGSSAVESWGVPLLDIVSICGTPAAADVETDTTGALGDGEVGGFKSGYLQA